MMTWILYNAVACVPLALLVLLLLRSRRVGPGIVHLAWILVLLRLIAPPLPSAFSLSSTATATPAPVAFIDSSVSATQRDAVAWMSAHFGTNWSGGLVQIALGIWILGGLWVLLREMRHALRMRTLLSSSTELAPPTADRVSSIAKRLGIRAPEARQLEGIASPFLWAPPWPTRRGTLLVLPTNSEELPTSVIAHELVHLRRKDHWSSRLVLLTLSVCWWNPLAWLACRRAQLAAELSCDLEVLHALPGERHEYARSLVDTLERDLDSNRHVQSVGATRAIGWSADELSLRLERILHSDESSSSRLWPKIAAFALLLLSLPGLGAPSVGAFRRALPSIPNALPEDRCRVMLGQADQALLVNPGDGQALATRGRALLGLGEFERGGEAFDAQHTAGFEPSKASYNAACAYALAGQVDLALDRLERSIAEGTPAAYLELDPDLQGLSEEPRFLHLLNAESSTR